MPYSNDEVDDLVKLRMAFAEVVAKFASIDDILEAFGLADLPQAQRYGILFGCLVFTLTVVSVISLLIFGGSFKRIAQQAETGEVTIVSASDARAQRALLLETLLEGRERMLRNYKPAKKTTGLTNLTTMLMNEAPGHSHALLVEDKEAKNEDASHIPPHYQENYELAYRKCQDRPGGGPLSGRPEARFEAYARGYAGCGPYTSTTYRRSYGRLYEAICCSSHEADDKYLQLFKTNPGAIIGKRVRLEALRVEQHLSDMFVVTSGDIVGEKIAYNPQEIWSFQPEGPFKNETDMLNSFVFQHKENEAAFAIIDNVTDRLLGALLLVDDNPSNLSIQIEAPILPPDRDGTQEQMESCFLLLDKLFAYGYRRIQICIDSEDHSKRRLASRLGFTLEGVLYKHMVVKESSRDSNVYGLLNSDWKKGARAALFKKLYGAAALRADLANEKKEAEQEEQRRVLAEKAAKEKNL